MPVKPKHKIISLILKAAVILSAVTGTVLSAESGRQAFMGGGSVWMYFTIQSNIAIALICFVGAVLLLAKGGASDLWYTVKFVGTVSITLTGVVFCFVLAPTMGGAAWTVPNLLTHVAVPVLSVVDFFLTGIYGNIKKRSIVWVTVPPLLYAVFAGIGYVRGWQFSPGHAYPYFFLNWGSPAGAFGFSRGLPFMGCVWWILALCLFLICVGAVYLALLGKIRKASAPRD